MRTPEPLHVAFVWHMHQPYYRSTPDGPFHMPWARLHALKDYGTMVATLADYPSLHQTFNLVPSLVEQLETYASRSFHDLYWELTLKPAADLDPQEKAFVVERMCEVPSHPRASRQPHYLQLARKREAEVQAQAVLDWQTCAKAFSVQELRDLQVWFNLAWFPPAVLEEGPLSELVAKGHGFSEADKLVIAEAQAEILSRVLTLYREAAARGQVEISTSPYFHPILPLLVNSDLARVSVSDAVLPRRRFAHPEDAWEHVQLAVAKHTAVFGSPPAGMWCPEQAVGEDVLPLLLRARVRWTIADELVLARSLAATAGRTLGVLPERSPEERRRSGLLDGVPSPTIPGGGAGAAGTSRPGGSLPLALLYAAYRLPREEGELSIVFRDHTLSDLIGFTYHAWDSKTAAQDLLQRLRRLAHEPAARLVTIALDGENPWDHYPRNGQDFLRFLYEGLAGDPELRSVTISEHLREMPPVYTLDWLHTGSWIGADLRTWSGDPAHNLAWDLLHDARDAVARRREGQRLEATATPARTDESARHDRTSGATPDSAPGLMTASPRAGAPCPTDATATPHPADEAGSLAQTSASVVPDLDTAWHHILVAEGSDWFWWFGVHHHTELDHVWDAEFRRHLQEAYRALGEPVPAPLLLPLLDKEDLLHPLPQRARIRPVVDGRLTETDGWELAGRLAEEPAATMQRAGFRIIDEARFALDQGGLSLLLVPIRQFTPAPDRAPDAALERDSVVSSFNNVLLAESLHGLFLEVALRTIDGRPVLEQRLSLSEAGLPDNLPGPPARGLRTAGLPAAAPDGTSGADDGTSTAAAHETSGAADETQAPAAEATGTAGEATGTTEATPAAGEPTATGEKAAALRIAAWEVLEIYLPLPPSVIPDDFSLGLELRIMGRPDVEQVFHTRGLANLGVA